MVVLTRPGGPVVDRVLDTLAAQRVAPDRVVVCGLPAEGEQALRAQRHPLAADGVEVLCCPAGPAGDQRSSRAGQLAQARSLLPDDAARWVWLLLDDSLPAPGALRALLEPARRSGRVGVVGPKLLRSDDPRTVISVGHRLSRAGRSVEPASTGWVDQGQFDDRTDVLGVPLPGLLVRSDVLADIGGIDRGLGEGTEGLDISWRAHLRGHRVVVAPAATVEQDVTGLGYGPPGTHRRRVRQVALARTSLWSLPLRAAGIVLSSVAAFVGLLLLKRPRAALTELGDLAAVISPGPSLGARWRFRGRRRVSDRDLSGLFASRRLAWRSTGEGIRDALGPPDRLDEPHGSDGRRAGVETGPVPDEAADPGETTGGRWWSAPLVLAVLAAAGVLVARWRELLTGLAADGYGVRGGELSAISAGAGDVWWAWALPWSGAGTGSPGQGPPWLLPVAALTWVAERLPGGPGTDTSAAVTTTWLLAGTLPLSVLTAYLALRVSTRRRVVRAVGGLTWAGLAPLSVATDQGRLGPAVVHLLAPLVVAALVRAAGREPRAHGSRASWGAGLLLAACSWWVPGLVPWAVAAAVVVGVAARGAAKLRALVVALVPVALWGPWVLQVRDQPWLLAGGPGATTVEQTPPGWQLLLLHPGGPADPSLWWSAPLWLLALGGVAVRGAAGRLAAVAMTLAGLGLAVALLAPLTPFATMPVGSPEAGTQVSGWPGTFLSLCAAGVLVAAGVAVEAVLAARPARRPGAGPVRRSTPASTAALVLVAVAAVATLGTVTWRALSTPGDSLGLAGAPVPVMVAEQAEGPTGLRLLTLVPQGDPDSYAVRFDLSGSEPGPWVRDRARELAHGSSAASALAGDDPVRLAVAAVADGGSEPGAGVVAARALSDLAVGYVMAPVHGDHPLATGLDTVPGLTQVTGPQGTVLWRVTPPAGAAERGAARVSALGADGEAVSVLLPMTGPHGQTSADLPQGSTSVVISAPPAWAEVADVSVDGRRLALRGPALPVTYDLPEGADELRIDIALRHRAWWLGTAAAALVVAFLALPFSGDRRRRPS